MKSENWEFCMALFLGWIFSGIVSFLTLITYWFGDVKGWNFELTLLLVINFGILGILIILTLIITFLCRFKIVRR